MSLSNIIASPNLNTPALNEGILIGDKLYSEVYLAIDSSIVPEERLSPTPSMLDGLDLETEIDLRILGCELIQSAGILLRLPQVRNTLGYNFTTLIFSINVQRLVFSSFVFIRRNMYCYL